MGMRSNKLNSAVDMLFEQLKSKVDYYWEKLREEFTSIDSKGTGHVTREEFKDVLQDLCIEMTDYECTLVCDKFDPKKENRVNYFKFLEPFARRRRMYRQGNNMVACLNHPQAELPVDDIGPNPNKGLSGVTTK